MQDFALASAAPVQQISIVLASSLLGVAAPKGLEVTAVPVAEMNDGQLTPSQTTLGIFPA